MKRRRKPLPKAPPIGSLGGEDIFGSLVLKTWSKRNYLTRLLGNVSGLFLRARAPNASSVIRSLRMKLWRPSTWQHITLKPRKMKRQMLEFIDLLTDSLRSMINLFAHLVVPLRRPQAKSFESISSMNIPSSSWVFGATSGTCSTKNIFSCSRRLISRTRMATHSN